MKRFRIIIVLLTMIPVMATAQIVGVGTQYVPTENGANAMQFQANLSFPVWFDKNPLNLVLFSGIDYTGGSSPVAGVNFKPIQLQSYLSESLFNNNKFSFMIGGDAGYLLNHRHGKSGIVLTPYVYADYPFKMGMLPISLYVKSGWDFNVTGKRDQFFIRIGFGISINSFKALAPTKIR